MGGSSAQTKERAAQASIRWTGASARGCIEADAALVDQRRHRRPARAGRRVGSDDGGTSCGALLRKVADRIEDRFEEFVAAEVADTGKPVAQARELDVARAVANFRSFADTVAAAGQLLFMPDPRPTASRHWNDAVRKPLGVVAVIVPWNLPLLLLTWKVVPACSGSRQHSLIEARELFLRWHAGAGGEPLRPRARSRRTSAAPTSPPPEASRTRARPLVPLAGRGGSRRCAVRR